MECIKNTHILTAWLVLLILLLVVPPTASQSIQDFKLVYEGDMPPESLILRYPQYMGTNFKFIQIPGEKGVSLIMRDETGFTFYRFGEDNWESFLTISAPINTANDEKYANERVWTTGDVNKDGQDEIIVFDLNPIELYEYDRDAGQFEMTQFNFPYFVGDALIGDIDNNGENELVLFCYKQRVNDDHTGELFYLCVVEVIQDEINIKWNNEGRHKFGITVIVPYDYLECIADIENTGINQLVITEGQTDPSPTRYNLFTWDTDSLALTKRFSIVGGDINRHTEDIFPYATGPLVPIVVDSKTKLIGSMVDHGNIWRTELFEIVGNQLIREELDFLRGLWVDPDGKGKGILQITRDRFKFFRAGGK